MHYYLTIKVTEYQIKKQFCADNIEVEQKVLHAKQFYDPRPNHANEEIFSNDIIYEVRNDGSRITRSINFCDKNGNYCCSYIGNNKEEIFQNNCNDCASRDRKEQIEKLQSEIQNKEYNYDYYNNHGY